MVVICLIAVLLVGLSRRRLVGECYTFAAYLLAVGITDAMPLLWPRTFWTHGFWTAKETLLGALKLALALELAHRILGLFPGAAARARTLLWPLVLFAVVATARMPIWITMREYGNALTVRSAEMQGWSIWLLAVTLLVATYHNLPVLRLHRAIGYGMVAYLGVFATLLNLLGKYGVEHDGARLAAYAVGGWAYIAMLCWWSYAVWRPDEDLSVETLAMIRTRNA